MDFVKSFDLLGKEAKQIACIEIAGAPTTSTIGAVGVLGMDTKTGDLYTCTAVSSGAYTWVKLISDDEVDEKIAEAQLGGGEVDLSEYAKKTDLTDYALKTDIPNVTDYATKVYVDDAIRVAIEDLIEQYLSGDEPDPDEPNPDEPDPDEPDEPTPTHVTYYIENTTYKSPAGTTWEQQDQIKLYDYDGYLTPNGDGQGSGPWLMDPDTIRPVIKSDVIKDGKVYYFNDTIWYVTIDTHSFPMPKKDMTWAEFVNNNSDFYCTTSNEVYHKTLGQIKYADGAHVYSFDLIDNDATYIFASSATNVVKINGNYVADYPGDNVKWGDFIEQVSGFSVGNPDSASSHYTHIYYNGTYGTGYIKYGDNYVTANDDVKAYDYGLSN